MKKYGIPYQGSKNKILGQICRYFPKADHFYDIFGGGFSVTHFMAENRANDYKEFHYNEIRKDVPRLIKDAIRIKKNSIIYLDPPYIGTADYGSSFNHKEFYDWAASIDEPVFISEYSLDDSRFFKIANFKKRSLMSRSGVNNIKDEGLWVNKKARSILLKR